MVSNVFEKLETERLVLRRVLDSDALMLYNNIYNNFDWYKYYFPISICNFQQYKILLNKINELYAKNNCFRWGIVEKKSNQMIGLVQLRGDEYLDKNCKISYIIGYNYSKKGYASEAVRKILEFGFEKVNCDRIEANIVVDNFDSIKLAENLGMTYEYTEKDCYKLGNDYYDQKVYTLSRYH